MNTALSIWVIVLSFGASMLFSGLETGGYVLNRIRLRARVRQGDRAARRLHHSLRHASRFIFTVLISNNIANYLLAREVTRLYSALPVLNPETVATLTLMLPLFIFGELIPKDIFRHRADSLMYRFSFLLDALRWMFAPVTAVLDWFFNVISGGGGRQETQPAVRISMQGFREYFSAQAPPAALSVHQHGMIDRLVAMDRITAGQVMHPVAEMPCVSIRTAVKDVLNLLRSGQATQVAVYGGPVRNVCGFVHVFDLMDPALDRLTPVRPLVRREVRVAAGMPLSGAFRVLRRKGVQSAAVIDPAGRIAGLLHLRDIARYIVQDSSGTAG